MQVNCCVFWPLLRVAVCAGCFYSLRVSELGFVDKEQKLCDFGLGSRLLFL